MRSAKEQEKALVATELAFFALTVAAAIGFARVFDGWSFLPPLLLAAAASHLLAAACRRRGWNVLLAGLVSLAGLAELVTLGFYRSTSAYGLPTTTTWDLMWADLELAWTSFPTAMAPVPAITGYVVAAVIGVWLAAFLADAFAFRALAAIEAILPSGILFVFAAALGTDRLRLFCTALWLGAAIVAYALHRTMAQDTTGWLAGIRRGTLGTVLRTAGVIGAVVVLLALVVGPALPGAGEEALLDTRRSTSGIRQTVSPLVDIRGRIVDRSELEAFTVASTAKSYWRLTALEDFDGQLWTSERGYGDADGELGGGLPPELTTPVDQDFVIGALDAIWLPAAYAPERISSPNRVRYDEQSASIVVRRSEVEPGFAYQVHSLVPNLDPAVLQAATAPPPDDIAEDHLDLPDDFPDSLRNVAAQIAAGQTTPYDQARALQDWFQANFVYDLSVPAGTSTNAIVRFLEARRGYCEQFAGTFAAFARALGIPSRVAVGYTPGELRADGRYHVLGKHAHAWPEVYLTGVGWVPFEPTPSRGMPGAETYTGVPAQQEGEAPVAPASTVPTATSVPSATTVPRDFDIDPGELFPADLGNSLSEPEQSGPPRWLVAGGLLLLVAAVLGGLWLLVSPRLVRAIWDRRHRSARTGAGKVLVSWQEATAVLGRDGTPARPSETPLELAGRLRVAGDPDADLVQALADDVTVAAYARDDASEALVAHADEARRELEERRHRRASRKERLGWRADPRPMLYHPPAARPADEVAEREPDREPDREPEREPAGTPG